MIKAVSKMLALSLLISSVMLGHGCSVKRTYIGITRADDLDAEIYVDDSMLRESLLQGKKGFQSSMKELKKNEHHDYGNLYTHCEILSSFFVMFANHRSLFSCEIDDIYGTFRYLLLCADEDRVKCAVTHIYYHPELLPENDLFRLEELTISKNPYVKKFARRIVLSRADDDLSIFDGSFMELRLEDEDLLRTVCRYWHDVGQIKYKDNSGVENRIDYFEKKHAIKMKYKGLLKAGK